MNITHISAECYPIAKVGGLADVVGALPKYLNNKTTKAQVIMPFYNNTFTNSNTFKSVFKSKIKLGKQEVPFNVKTLVNNTLDFNIFFIDIPEFLFKEYVYSNNDTKRFLAFQIAALDWLLTKDTKPDIIHCHDHHTGLIPFMLQESYKYNVLNKTPNIFTIHNAQYQGSFSHDNVNLIPEFNFNKVGLLDWDGQINPLATAIKCAWAVTTVSSSYMTELTTKANGLETLLKAEQQKCSGILNGIDCKVWNPETDSFIVENYTIKTAQKGRLANKKYLCDKFNLDINKPLFGFIGRLVYEKGSDIFPDTFKQSLTSKNHTVLLLGSGDKNQEEAFINLKNNNEGLYNTFIGYNEALSHIVYAGADFLLMPSRVEPCGLNQMYALRYGTIPIVRSTGGLKDTVIDMALPNGFGFCHQQVEPQEIINNINRAVKLYNNEKTFNNVRKKIMNIDHSWDTSAKEYIKLYNSLNQI